MDERRAHKRDRVIYGATVALSPSGPRRDCVIRNISEGGANIQFGYVGALPDELALSIARKNLSCTARVVWWRDNTVGVAFGAHTAATLVPDSDLEERLRRSERKARQLRQRVRALTGGA